MTYSPPLKDIRFTLDEVAAIGGLKAQPVYAELSDDLIYSVLSEAGKIAAEVFAPLNRAGDVNPAKLVDRGVRTSPGFKEAYDAFAAGGWLGLTADPDFGGAGLPHTIACAVYEMFNSANASLTLGPILALGAVDAISHHASEELKRLYLPKIVSGEWLATMNLTESQAGSDLSDLKTRAAPQADGSYRLFGSKIFISWGDHDLTDNIIHLVLARTPDAPEGSRGISLFLAPKVLVNPDGSLGAANDLRCTRLEEKMGLHGSPTCAMSYGEKDGAVGYMIGAENKGLAAMFTMMNAERLFVGLQGVGVAERAYQAALSYARDRRQGRADGSSGTARLIDHPDVRRMLFAMKSKIEGARAICYMTAIAADEAAVEENPEDRAFAKRREEFLTPIAKAWSTDMAIEVASLGVQVHGGMGYVEETGAAQYSRDARVFAIYEGTNGIQAIDLVNRKLGLGNGAALREIIADIRQSVEDCATSSSPELKVIGERLGVACAAMESAAHWLSDISATDRRAALSGATPFLALAGDVCAGWGLTISAVAAVRRLKEGDGDEVFLKGKIATARFFADAILVLADGKAQDVRLGAEALFGVSDDALSSV